MVSISSITQNLQHPIDTLLCGSKNRMCHPEGPQCVCIRHWSCGQVSRMLQQLSPFSVAACEPLPSPYQAVQDMIFYGQAHLTGTYHASVTACICRLAHVVIQCLILQHMLRRSLTASSRQLPSGRRGKVAAAGAGGDSARTAVCLLRGAVLGNVAGIQGARAQVAAATAV